MSTQKSSKCTCRVRTTRRSMAASAGCVVRCLIDSLATDSHIWSMHSPKCVCVYVLYSYIYIVRRNTRSDGCTVPATAGRSNGPGAVQCLSIWIDMTPYLSVSKRGTSRQLLMAIESTVRVRMFDRMRPPIDRTIEDMTYDVSGRNDVVRLPIERRPLKLRTRQAQEVQLERYKTGSGELLGSTERQRRSIEPLPPLLRRCLEVLATPSLRFTSSSLQFSISSFSWLYSPGQKYFSSLLLRTLKVQRGK